MMERIERLTVGGDQIGQGISSDIAGVLSSDG